MDEREGSEDNGEEGEEEDSEQEAKGAASITVRRAFDIVARRRPDLTVQKTAFLYTLGVAASSRRTRLCQKVGRSVLPSGLPLAKEGWLSASP